MVRAANNLPPNRKASERERAYFKQLADQEAAVPKTGNTCANGWPFWDVDARYERLRSEACEETGQ